MEYGLGHYAQESKKVSQGSVLILVLMEYGLGEGDKSWYGTATYVLILVLMEYGLGVCCLRRMRLFVL